MSFPVDYQPNEIERAQALIGRIFVRRPLLPMKLGVERSPVPNRLRLTIDFTQPDNYADDGNLKTIHLTHDDVPLDAPEPVIVRAFRNLIGFVYIHEVDETFYLDGKLFRDPHQNGGPGATVCLCPEAPCEHLR